ncbi:uncharacterized protein LAJ45_10276 [Morchella importuna]|uniref:uncharacterized protein n=1 Tax=Morchella importuna TaxID=1174673 RepID=UPI001E8E73D8|nr:uncharacterized protein LAJ45_10276 [Morchella importuna]KAH8145636.1 hypothetical protein LAJ45_10276 [Morchella importuna]
MPTFTDQQTTSTDQKITPARMSSPRLNYPKRFCLLFHPALAILHPPHYHQHPRCTPTASSTPSPSLPPPSSSSWTSPPTPATSWKPPSPSSTSSTPPSSHCPSPPPAPPPRTTLLSLLSELLPQIASFLPICTLLQPRLRNHPLYHLRLHQLTNSIPQPGEHVMLWSLRRNSPTNFTHGLDIGATFTPEHMALII